MNFRRSMLLGQLRWECDKRWFASWHSFNYKPAPGARTPENTGEGLLDWLERKFRYKIWGVGRKVRVRTDLPRNGQKKFGQILKNPKKYQVD